MKEKKKFKDILNRIVPIYAIPSLVFLFLFNQTIYTGTQFLMKNAYHYNLVTKIDNYVPFAPWWISIYVGCYIFWVINYILIARQGKEVWYRFLVADLMAKAICGVIFIVMPTMIERPEVIGNTIFHSMTRIIYSLDMPTNLFPSIHCLASWLCYIGLGKSNKIPKWYKIFSCIFALLVCASTQFTKQHYILDVISGIAIAQLTYYIAQKTNLYKYLINMFDKINSFFIKQNKITTNRKAS